MSFIPDSFASYLSIQALVAAVIAWILYIAVSRLFLHPLKSFPGPRLAAVTELYAAYFEVWKDGLIVKHIEDLHRVYGPIIRIRPNELHFSTPTAYFEIYSSQSSFTKDPAFYSSIGAEESSFGYLVPREHKIRMDLLNPLFSRRAIINFERTIQDTIELFVESLRGYRDKPINFRHAFRCLTMDIITTYCYGVSYGGVTSPNFVHPIPMSHEGSVIAMAVSRYVPYMLRALQMLPPDLFKNVNKTMAGYAYLLNSLRVTVDEYLANPALLRKADHETIYHHLLPESVDPAQWPSKQSLINEALTLFGAGMDTTSHALSIGIFHILLEENAAVRKTLEDELIKAWPEKDSPFSYGQAEKLPYLSGVVKESLRLSIGVPLPLPRLVGSPTTIDGAYIPAGTVVGSSAKFILMNPTIFPQPEKFIPERWIQSNSAELDRYLVVFSRGPRSCLGKNLAWCEMYITLSHLLRKFEMRLFDTSAEDMEVREYILPVWRGRGLHVSLEERSD